MRVSELFSMFWVSNYRMFSSKPGKVIKKGFLNALKYEQIVNF